MSARKSAGRADGAGFVNGIPILAKFWVYGIDVESDIAANATYADASAMSVTVATKRHVRLRVGPWDCL